MKKQNPLKINILLLILTFTLAIASQTTKALITKNAQTWYWTNHTLINSVAIGDMDGDDKNEIITGRYWYDNFYRRWELCVWNGATLALKNSYEETEFTLKDARALRQL